MRREADQVAIGSVLLLGLSLLLTACLSPAVPAGTKSDPSNSPFGQAAQAPSPVASPATASPASASPAAASPLPDAEATALIASRRATAIAVQDEHIAATAQAVQAAQATQAAVRPTNTPIPPTAPPRPAVAVPP